MAKKKTAPKEKEVGFDLVAWNHGEPLMPVFVGDQVTVYKVPCKRMRESYRGIVVKVLRPAVNGVWAEIQPLGKEVTTIDYIYCGKTVPRDVKLS